MDARANALIKDTTALIEGAVELTGASRVSLEQTNALQQGTRGALASSREMLERTRPASAKEKLDMGNNSSGDRWFWMTVVAMTISWASGASVLALSAISAAG